jgi:molybdopterin-binding protein
MALSARNELEGTVVSVERGEVAAEVVVELDGGETATATITVGSVDRLGLAEGESVSAVVKASDVMIDTG